MEVKITSKIYEFAANVTVIQLFQNEEPTSIEESSAIYSFTAKTDGREMEAQ